MKVLWVHKCNTAVSMYRMWTPAKYLARLPGWSCHTFSQWLTFDRLLHAQSKWPDLHLPSLAAQADIAIYGWFGSPMELNALTSLRKAVNVPSLLELDDDVLNVPEGHAAYEAFAKRDPAACWEHKPISPEAIKTFTQRGWQIGRTPEGQLVAARPIAPDFHTDFARILEQINGLTVSTPFLAEAYRKHVPERWPIYNLPNCYDPDVWGAVEQAPERPYPTLVWAGSMAHSRNIDMIREALKRVFKEEPRTKLVVLGAAELDCWKKLPAEHLEFASWCHFDSYPQKLASLGGWVGLAPLEDNDFNRGKSHIRWMEYALAGLAPICSPSLEYKAWAGGGTTFAGSGAAFASTSEEWSESMLTLIHNHAERYNLRERALDAVLACNIKKHIHTWADSLHDAVQKGVSMFGLPEHLSRSDIEDVPAPQGSIR